MRVSYDVLMDNDLDTLIKRVRAACEDGKWMPLGNISTCCQREYDYAEQQEYWAMFYYQSMIRKDDDA